MHNFHQKSLEEGAKEVLRCLVHERIDRIQTAEQADTFLEQASANLKTSTDILAQAGQIRKECEEECRRVLDLAEEYVIKKQKAADDLYDRARVLLSRAEEHLTPLVSDEYELLDQLLVLIRKFCVEKCQNEGMDQLSAMYAVMNWKKE